MSKYMMATKMNIINKTNLYKPNFPIQSKQLFNTTKKAPLSFLIYFYSIASCGN